MPKGNRPTGVSALGAGTQTVMTGGGQMVLIILFSLLPAVLYVLVGLTLTRYDLGKQLPQIRADLAERRAAVAAEKEGQQ